jgi:hypothetical protein
MPPVRTNAACALRHVYDERKEGEEIQPGDLVIELRDGGKIFIQTEPEGRSR